MNHTSHVVRRLHKVSEDNGQSETGYWALRAITSGNSAFLCCQEFSKVLSIATNTQSTKMPHTSLSKILLSRISCFGFYFLLLFVFYYYYFFFFGSTCEMRTRPSERFNYDVLTGWLNGHPGWGMRIEGQINKLLRIYKSIKDVAQ